MEPNQPRAPKDMQGLLKFCIEATKSEDAPDNPNDTLESMDPTRRQWLENALSSMSVDVIKELIEGIKILNTVKNPNISQDDIEKVEYAFECISDWVDQVDMANNFHKIGGFDSLKICLKSDHASIRSASANTIAELSQNNPYCQENFVKEEFLPILLDMITNDRQCQVKAMYAISCITRESTLAQEAFLNQYNGPSIIMNATMTTENQENNGKLRIKAFFFISSLCQENELAKNAFVEMGLARQILTLMQLEEHSESHEHMARALLILLKDSECESKDFVATREWQEIAEGQRVPGGLHYRINFETGKREAKILEKNDESDETKVTVTTPTVKNELVNSKELKLKEFLRARMNLIQGREEFEEELEYLKEIAKQCYGIDNLNDAKKNLNCVDR